MKVLMINVVCGIRSTGRICTDLAESLEAQGHVVRIAYGREKVPDQYKRLSLRVGTELDTKIHGIKARLFDGCGYGSSRITRIFIEWIIKFDPDVIHLHNLHGYYINIELLFNYLRTCGKRIIWTLHDCWAFTGHAAFCEAANCNLWKSRCQKCPKKNDYPKSFYDNSKNNWQKKKHLLQHIPNMTIVTPSIWLEKLVKESFLEEYPITVIRNGVDTTVFKPIKSDIKTRLCISNKRIVLGVAALWEKRKGLEDFVRLSTLLDSQYQIVLIGISPEIKEKIPKSIVCIERTDSVEELAEYYSMADYYLNLTYEDNYPTTNIEAISCGTPVITYNTGGSGESASLYGYSFEKGDIRGVAKAINSGRVFEKNDCKDVIDKNYAIGRYLELYDDKGTEQ